HETTGSLSNGPKALAARNPVENFRNHSRDPDTRAISQRSVRAVHGHSGRKRRPQPRFENRFHCVSSRSNKPTAARPGQVSGSASARSKSTFGVISPSGERARFARPLSQSRSLLERL